MTITSKENAGGLPHVLLVSLAGDIDADIYASYDAALAALRQRADAWDEMDDPHPELDRSMATLEQLSELYADSMDKIDTWCQILPCFDFR